MSKILFVPVCSKCERIIRSTVDYEVDGMNIDGSKSSFIRNGVIVPERCHFCGARFDSISMPTKLPFDPDQFFYADNTCIVCGAVIPEGRQICHKCEMSY